MENSVILTDDELCVIQTALQLTLMSYEKYKTENNQELDTNTLNTVDEMQILFNRINNEFF